MLFIIRYLKSRRIFKLNDATNIEHTTLILMLQVCHKSCCINHYICYIWYNLLHGKEQTVNFKLKDLQRFIVSEFTWISDHTTIKLGYTICDFETANFLSMSKYPVGTLRYIYSEYRLNELVQLSNGKLLSFIPIFTGSSLYHIIYMIISASVELTKSWITCRTSLFVKTAY